MKSPSCVQLFATPWTIQYMEFSRPQYWSGYMFPSPGDLPSPGIELGSPALKCYHLFSTATFFLIFLPTAEFFWAWKESLYSFIFPLTLPFFHICWSEWTKNEIFCSNWQHSLPTFSFSPTRSLGSGLWKMKKFR